MGAHVPLGDNSDREVDPAGTNPAEDEENKLPDRVIEPVAEEAYSGATAVIVDPAPPDAGLHVCPAAPNDCRK